MSYLATARDFLAERENTPTRYEINEINEISPRLAPTEAESLKAQIVAAVTVDPAVFDRPAYEALVVRWEAHDAAGGAS